MDQTRYFTDVFKKYTVFEGRAGLKEYWMFILSYIIISIILAILDSIIFDDSKVLGGLFCLAVFLPSLAVAVRRFHDTNRSGWYCLLALIPIVGWIIAIVFLAQEGQKEENTYGPVPPVV